MNFTDPAVDAYLYSLLPASAPVLAEMEEQARQRNIPIVGPAVGRFFSLLAQTSGAKRVFELGSAIAYSTLWWAEGVGEGGEVFYTDNSPANAAEAASYIHRVRPAARIHVLEGDAMEMFRRTPGMFDIVFCDFDKAQYPEALRQAVPRIRPGGLFVADNVLYSGEVAKGPASAAAQSIAEMNRMIYADPRLYPVILPLRDGVAVCRVRPA